jgi:signal transduction histidine kinase
LRIEVCDSGPGIPLAKKKLVFQPFFSGRARGMGLGLSIVEGIVAAHGGSASETGEEGKGARFVLVLPFGTPNPS